MSKRSMEFLDRWVKANLHATAPKELRGGPREWAEQCALEAYEAGISREELEEDFGDLTRYMEMAIADEAAIRAEAARHEPARTGRD